MAYVYRHIRKDNNEVFYVGIGSDNQGKYIRAYSKDRNGFWYIIKNKTEYVVEIVFDNITWEEACNKEIQLIKEYGRKNLGLGTLVNLTDGGEGNLGVVVSEETRIKLREINLKNGNKPPAMWGHKFNLGRKHSEETQKKRSLALKGRTFSDETRKLKSEIAKSKGQRPYQPIGFKHSEETKKRLSEIKKGIKPNMNQEWCKNISKGKQGLKQPKVVCPHCNKEGGEAAMTRYHFDNCKFNKK